MACFLLIGSRVSLSVPVVSLSRLQPSSTTELFGCCKGQLADTSSSWGRFCWVSSWLLHSSLLQVQVGHTWLPRIGRFFGNKYRLMYLLHLIDLSAPFSKQKYCLMYLLHSVDLSAHFWSIFEQKLYRWCLSESNYFYFIFSSSYMIGVYLRE